MRSVEQRRVRYSIEEVSTYHSNLSHIYMFFESFFILSTSRLADEWTD